MKASQRYKQVYEDFTKHLVRLKWSLPVSKTITTYVLDNLPVADIEEALPYTKEDPINIKMLENQEVYNEMLKCIGLMEVSKSEEELKQLLDKRKEFHWGVRGEEQNFDDVMKKIIKSPNPFDD